MGTTAYGGKGPKGGAVNGDRPIGAASCRRGQHSMATCQPPPPQAMATLQGTVVAMDAGTTPLGKATASIVE